MSRLYNILDGMADRTKNTITTSATSTTITRTAGASKSVTALDVAGYEFVCWIAVSTSGWIGSLYFENPVAKTTNVWLVTATGLNGQPGNIACRALYRKV